MKSLSRRKFLGRCVGGCTSLLYSASIAQVFGQKLAFAQSTSPAYGPLVVDIIWAGGADPSVMFPCDFQGQERESFRSNMGALFVPEEDRLFVPGMDGERAARTLHKNWIEFYNELGGTSLDNFCFLDGIGQRGHGGSHEAAFNQLRRGKQNLDSVTSDGPWARLAAMQNWESFHYALFNVQEDANIPEGPNANYVSINSLSTFGAAPRGVDPSDGNLIDEKAQEMVRAIRPRSEEEEKLRNRLIAMHERIPTIRQIEREQLSSTFPSDPYGVGDLFRDAAKFIKYMARTAPGRGLYVGIAVPLIFDTHAQALSLVPMNTQILSQAMAGLTNVLKNTQEQGGFGTQPVWNRTLAMCTTEFGRRLEFNGSGTDHGSGGVSLVFGGTVQKRGRIGDAPTLSDIQGEEKNHRLRIDSRDLIYTACRIAGVNHTDITSRILNEEGYNPQLLSFA